MEEFKSYSYLYLSGEDVWVDEDDEEETVSVSLLVRGTLPRCTIYANSSFLRVI